MSEHGELVPAQGVRGRQHVPRGLHEVVLAGDSLRLAVTAVVDEGVAEPPLVEVRPQSAERAAIGEPTVQADHLVLTLAAHLMRQDLSRHFAEPPLT
jgi:hypothetical protein